MIISRLAITLITLLAVAPTFAADREKTQLHVELGISFDIDQELLLGTRQNYDSSRAIAATASR